MKINPNDTVRVLLTKAGEEVAMSQDAFLSLVRLDGMMECKLWQLMRIFGHRMRNGGPLYFEGNEIEVIHHL